MKGPEEKEHASGCNAEWLVDQSRESMTKGDVYAAKSWLLTAKTLYPKAFPVQVRNCCQILLDREASSFWFFPRSEENFLDMYYEAFLMEKRNGNLSHCGRLFFEMLKIFPKEELLWRELRKLVQSQDLNINELDSETKFLRDMCESLPMKYQRQLLLRYADNQKDLIERSRISLVVMKKFHGGTRQYGVKLTELLTKTEKSENFSTPLNIYRKMLVCDVLPVILKSSEVQVDAPGIKHKASVTYLDEKLMFHWLELCFEFFLSLNIQQTTLKYRSYVNADDVEQNLNVIDPDGDIGQHPWQSLHEIVLLFAAKFGWINVLKLKDKLDPSKNRSIRSKWKALSNAKDAKSPWGIFYSVLELYLYAVMDYCSRMIATRKGQRDSDVIEYILLESIEQSNQALSSQLTPRPQKKKRKLEDGSAASSLEASIEDVNIQFSSITGQNFDLSDILQVAIDCRNFLLSNGLFEKEFARVLKGWSVENWKWLDIFLIDSLLYQRKYQKMIDLIKTKQLKNDTEDVSSTCTAKQMTQLAMSYHFIEEQMEACQMAINALFAISISQNFEERSPDDVFVARGGTVDGRCLQVLPCCLDSIAGFCVDLLISCLKERLPDVDIRPDKDKIGPLYETRQDNIIGHLIVLLQYNWPKGAHLFQQLTKTVTTLGGLKYKQFFQYVTNIDILEEFAYLNTIEKVQLELQDVNPGEVGRKTVTRGVNRENKEDFKSAIDAKISNDDEPLQEMLMRFLKNEQQSLVSLG